MIKLTDEKTRKWWCQCLNDLIAYHKNIDRAKGILSWSEEKGYTSVTSGAASSLKDSLKNLQETMRRCDLWFEGNVEAQKLLDEARFGSPKEALKKLGEADYLVRQGISKQCRDEFKLYYEATREEREKTLKEIREMRKK